MAGENPAKRAGRDGEVSVQSLGNRPLPGFPVSGRSTAAILLGHPSGSGLKGLADRGSWMYT